MTGILVMCMLLSGFFFGGVRAQAALPEAGSVAAPRWVTVRKAEAKLVLSGNSASCEINVEGVTEVSTITGTLKLILIKNDGTVESIQSWYLTGGRNLTTTKTITISSSGIYQLSFSGTVTMKGGSTENVTASDTKTY